MVERRLLQFTPSTEEGPSTWGVSTDGPLQGPDTTRVEAETRAPGPTLVAPAHRASYVCQVRKGRTPFVFSTPGCRNEAQVSVLPRDDAERGGRTQSKHPDPKKE